MTFNEWLDTLVEEKELDTEAIFEVPGKSEYGTNYIPLGCVIEAIKAAPKHEQAGIKTVLVKIDFCNGNVIDYFRHLAQAIAI